jgi:hypothetical protein
MMMEMLPRYKMTKKELVRLSLGPLNVLLFQELFRLRK